jgi:hypothetical protein
MNLWSTEKFNSKSTKKPDSYSVRSKIVVGAGAKHILRVRRKCEPLN